MPAMVESMDNLATILKKRSIKDFLPDTFAKNAEPIE
jgi:hypothetical protein